MDYQKEYATLVGQVDRVISLLEVYPQDDPIVQRAGALLLRAIGDAELRYIEEPA